MSKIIQRKYSTLSNKTGNVLGFQMEMENRES